MVAHRPRDHRTSTYPRPLMIPTFSLSSIPSVPVLVLDNCLALMLKSVMWIGTVTEGRNTLGCTVARTRMCEPTVCQFMSNSN